MEIERKFLIKEMPDDLKDAFCREIEQGYLNTSPVIRIRRDNEDYYLTYKGGGKMVREEYNLPINKKSFKHLIDKCDGKTIKKKRYNYVLDASCDPLYHQKLTAEIDIFKGRLEPLKFLEVEFESKEQALAFIPPKWFGDDVTHDPAYHNSNMI